LPVEARLERLEHDLRRLRRDLESAETVLGERSSLVELLRGYSPLLPVQAPPSRQRQLAQLFD
jgi:hypothetical protein